MKKYIFVILFVFASCAAYQNYQNLSPRDKAFYNLMVTQGKHIQYGEFSNQEERDNFLKNEGYLGEWEKLPDPIKEAIINHDIVKDAPEFTVYMAAGKPIKQNKQISLNEGEIKTLFYLKCSQGVNAGLFVDAASTCPKGISGAFSTLMVPPTTGGQLTNELLYYVVSIKEKKIIDVKIMQELPKVFY